MTEHESPRPTGGLHACLLPPRRRGALRSEKATGTTASLRKYGTSTQ
jgi:hypothetical protein